MAMPQTTGDWPLAAPNTTLTVRTSAWRYLEKWVDPQKEVIVLLWGLFGDQTDACWIINIVPHDELPTSLEQRPLKSRLNDYELIVLQPQHIAKLNGRTLLYEAGQLIIA